MTRDQLKEVNKLVAEYEHPGTMRLRRLVIGSLLWYKYGVTVDDMERASG